MKKLKRLLATVLALCCILACFDTTVFASDNTAWYSSRVGQRLADFNNYGYSSSYNTSSKGQCVWYVRGRAYEKLGVNTGLNGNGNAWYNNAIKAGLSTGYEVRSNSIACFNGGTYGHVIFVEWVDGDTVYYTEANKTADNVVSSDDGVLTKSTISGLRSRLSGSYQGCIYLTSSSPSPSYEIDSRYPTPFKAFTLQLWNTSNGKTPVYTSVGGTTAKDYIYNGYNNNDDECTIHEIYTNGWCKITVPGIDGYRYCETSVFLHDTSYPPNDQYLLESTQGYRRSDMSQTYKWCDKPNNGKWFLRVGKTGLDGYTQVIYWIDGEGDYLMWIKHNGSEIDGHNIGSDFYAYIINDDQWRHVTNDSDNVSLRKETGDENQIWRFSFQGDGYYKIINCADDKALDVNGAYSDSGTNVQVYSVHDSTAQLWMLCGRWNGEITLEPKCSTKCVLDVNGNSTEEGANVQIWEYNKTGAQKFAIWTDLPRTLTYDANGGTNAPAAQTKQYRDAFDLSSQKPTAPSYKITYNANGGIVSTASKNVSKTFKNWNLSRDGSGKSFDPGANVIIRGNATLYAQWDDAIAGTLTTPSRANYTFDGWYTSASGGTKVTSSSVISANTTLYAHWTHICSGGHSYTYKATKNPTVSATGTLTGTCSKCSGTTTVTLPKLNTTDYTKTVTKAATCTETGTDKYTWKTTTYGTFSFNVTTAAKGHTEVVDKAVAPTCTATGLTEGKHCSVCNAVIKAQTTVAALGHDYASKVTPPTCTAQGYTTYTCSRCSNSYKDNYTNPTVHNYTYKATKNPTTSATGTLTGTCSKCTGTTTVTLPKLNATDYTYKITKEATCTETGTARYTWKTTSYGSFYFDVTIAKAPCVYKTTVTAPTCTAQGYTTHTCTACGDSYKDTYTDPLGHNYSYKVTTTPTTSTTGKLTGTCSRCSGTTTVALPKLNTTDYTYKVTKEATCTATGTGRYTWKTTTYGTFYFDVTIAKIPHDYKATVTVPTCTERGYTTHICSSCNDSYVDSYVNALGHEWDEGSISQAPTCTQDGIKVFNCNRCSETKTESVAAIGHSYADIVTAPTCTEEGYTTHTCGSCGDSFVDSYTDALGHDWNEGTVTTEPTETETGIRTYTCERCAETKTEDIPTLEHTHSYEESVIAPTCTEQGYTVYTCTCGDSYTGNYVAALGHDYKVSVTEPTCTQSGYSTYTCCVCGNSYVADEVPATGHNYSNGSCLNCGKPDPNATITNPFADVKEADYFYTPVLWAVQNGITTGTSATTFEPNSPCTRGQIVTFLWRACGSPEPTSTQNPFTDVKSNEYYYKAVLWAVEEGITTGISATKFGPIETCTRGQVATFLWRAQGKPAPTNSSNPFSDVKASDYYYEAVLWAVENNITNGTGVGKFSPNDSCTRGQIVTFLYRALA